MNTFRLLKASLIFLVFPLCAPEESTGSTLETSEEYYHFFPTRRDSQESISDDGAGALFDDATARVDAIFAHPEAKRILCDAAELPERTGNRLTYAWNLITRAGKIKKQLRPIIEACGAKIIHGTGWRHKIVVIKLNDGYVLKIRNRQWPENSRRYQNTSRAMYSSKMNAVIAEKGFDDAVTCAKHVNYFIEKLDAAADVPEFDDDNSVIIGDFMQTITPEENLRNIRKMIATPEGKLDFLGLLIILAQIAHETGMWAFTAKNPMFIQNEDDEWIAVIPDYEKPGLGGGEDENYPHKNPEQFAANVRVGMAEFINLYVGCGFITAQVMLNLLLAAGYDLTEGPTNLTAIIDRLDGDFGAGTRARLGFPEDLSTLLLSREDFDALVDPKPTPEDMA